MRMSLKRSEAALDTSFTSLCRLNRNASSASVVHFIIPKVRIHMHSSDATRTIRLMMHELTVTVTRIGASSLDFSDLIHRSKANYLVAWPSRLNPNQELHRGPQCKHRTFLRVPRTVCIRMYKINTALFIQLLLSADRITLRAALKSMFARFSLQRPES